MGSWIFTADSIAGKASKISCILIGQNLCINGHCVSNPVPSRESRVTELAHIYLEKTAPVLCLPAAPPAHYSCQNQVSWHGEAWFIAAIAGPRGICTYQRHSSDHPALAPAGTSRREVVCSFVEKVGNSSLGPRFSNEVSAWWQLSHPLPCQAVLFLCLVPYWRMF